MSHSLRCRLKDLRYKKIITDRELERLCKALDTEKAIEDIRAEILEEKECAYADFERYKIEYLGVDEETVMDELPNDDFRYGMERCLEIIDRHTKGSKE